LRLRFREGPTAVEDLTFSQKSSCSCETRFQIGELTGAIGEASPQAEMSSNTNAETVRVQQTLQFPRTSALKTLGPEQRYICAIPVIVNIVTMFMLSTVAYSSFT